MKKSFKKLAALALSAVMVMSLAACGGKSENNSGTTESNKPASSDTGKGDNASDEKVVTLKWVTVGSGMPSNYDAWKAKLNPYLEEKIKVNLEFEVVTWADWDNRRSVIVNTNEPFDILFTNAGTFTSDVRLGAFMDVTDMLEKEAPELYKSMPEDYWKAASVNGRIYSVPSYKDSSRTELFVWDKGLADSKGIDYNNMHSLADVSDSLKKLATEEGKPSHILDFNGESALDKDYDRMGMGLPPLGVKYNDETRTVVSVFETPEIMDQLKILRDWYESGVINKDAATLKELPAYRMNYVAQGWPAAAKTNWSAKIGVEAIAVPWGDTIVSNDSVRGSLSCISSSSKNPEKALQLLELVNTDSKVRDALYYGLEGEDYEYTADGKIHRLKTDWPMAGYTQGSFFTVTPTDEVDFNQWDEVKALNEGAVRSVLLGFDFDYTDYADQQSNCVEIWNRYKSELLTGSVDPETTVAAMMKEMRAAGFDDLMKAAQDQINETFK